MRKCISFILVVALLLTLSSCGIFEPAPSFQVTTPTEATCSSETLQEFYDTVCESRALLDVIATDVCAAWKDATHNYDLSTNEINAAIENAKAANQGNIDSVQKLDYEIEALFIEAKTSNVSLEVKNVMSAYIEYRDSILSANEALDASGYVGISLNKDFLDRALQSLYVEL